MTTSALRLLPDLEPLEQAVEAFGRRLAAEGRSPNTASAYLRDLRQLTSVLLERHPGLTLGHVTSAMIDEALTSPAVVNSAAGTPSAPGLAAPLQGGRPVVFRLGGGDRAGRREPGPLGDLAAAAAHHTHLPDRAREAAAVKRASGAILEARPQGPGDRRAVPGHRHPATGTGQPGRGRRGPRRQASPCPRQGRRPAGQVPKVHAALPPAPLPERAPPSGQR